MEKMPQTHAEVRFFIDRKYYCLDVTDMSREQAIESLKREFGDDVEIIEDPPNEI